MKNLLSLILLTNVAFTSSFASVRSDVIALSQIAMGMNEHTVRGKNADEMLNAYYEAPEAVFKEIDQMEWSDETDFGQTSVKSALQMGTFAEGFLEESLEGLVGAPEFEREVRFMKAQLKALKVGWAPLILKLARQGVKFGYSGNGPGYCGVSFVELFIIDEKSHKVYEIFLSRSSSC